jgi:hypothetical protein
MRIDLKNENPRYKNGTAWFHRDRVNLTKVSNEIPEIFTD